MGGAAPRARGRSKRRQVGRLFEGLVALQARLRAANRCPWDREQTHDTLRPYLIEEACEVLDAQAARFQLRWAAFFALGTMFWLKRKKLVGSYLLLSAASRA